MQRFRGGLVFKAHSLCVSLNSRLESNKEEERKAPELPAEVGLATSLSVWLAVSMSVYLSLCLSVSMSIYLPVCLSVSMSVYISVYLSISPTKGAPLETAEVGLWGSA